MSYRSPKRIIQKAVREGFHALTNTEIHILAINGLAYEENDHDEDGDKIFVPCFTSAGYYASEFARSEMVLNQRIKKLKDTMKALHARIEASKEYFDTLLNDDAVLASIVDYNKRAEKDN